RFEPRLATVAGERDGPRDKGLLDRGIMPDPGQWRHWRPAMRVDHGIADRVEFAFARRLRGIRTLLALLHRDRLRRLLARLGGDESIGPADIERERLEFGSRRVVGSERGASLVANEGNVGGSKFF